MLMRRKITFLCKAEFLDFGCIRKLLCVFFVFALLSYSGNSQSVTPTTTNAGGGHFNNTGSYFRYYEWSIGELTLVSTVTPTDNSVVVYQGVLQPCTDRIPDPISANFLPGDFKIMPNPTTGKFEVNFFVRENGNMQLELVDALGKTIEVRSFPYNGCCRIEPYDISRLPAGVYMISATLIPYPNTQLNLKQVTRHSGLKIIKLR